MFHKSKGILHGTLYSDGPHLLCYFYLAKLCYIVLHGTPYSESNSTLLLLHCVTLKTIHLTLLYTVLHCMMTLCYIVYILLRFVTLCYIVLHGVTLYLMFYMDTLLEHSNSAATFMPRQREFYMEFIFGRNLPRHQRENRQ